MSIKFKKASKSAAKLRLGLMGPPGAGKTWTALEIATGLGGKIAVLDTENASASKYADRFSFDTVVLSEFAPRAYVEVIREAAAEGYGVLVIDSLSHAWAGKGGALEMADTASKKSKSGNSYTAWRDVTPEHNALVDAIIQSPMHIISTLRTKVDYVLEIVNGKSVPKKVGLAPITGKGLEYEFDIVFDMDDCGKCLVTKTRYSKLAGKAINQPGIELGKELAAWLSDGVQEVPKPLTHPNSTVVFATLMGAITDATDKESLLNAGRMVKENDKYLSPEETVDLRAIYRAKESGLSGN